MKIQNFSFVLKSLNIKQSLSNFGLHPQMNESARLIDVTVDSKFTTRK